MDIVRSFPSMYSLTQAPLFPISHLPPSFLPPSSSFSYYFCIFSISLSSLPSLPMPSTHPSCSSKPPSSSPPSPLPLSAYSPRSLPKTNPSTQNHTHKTKSTNRMYTYIHTYTQPLWRLSLFSSLLPPSLRCCLALPVSPPFSFFPFPYKWQR